MAKINNKTAVVGLGVLGVAGLAGAAFAASITAPDTNAGQGVETVDGFTVTDVEYSTNVAASNNAEIAEVELVEFQIVRDTQTLAVADANADVFLQLRDATGRSNWVECTVTGGAADCDTSEVSTSSAFTMDDVTGISVVAYDLAAAS